MNGDPVNQILELKKSLNMLYRKIIPEEEIKKTEIIILLKINDEEKITPSRLSKLTGFSKSMITMTLVNLEKKDMIIKLKGSDKRISYIILTEKGKNYAENFIDDIKKNLSELIKKIPEKDFKDFSSCLKQMNNYLKFLI
ncbi:MAG: MarR family winged helix-turn-helix transcriptional regulator [Thermoplasmata archaeon]